MPVLAISFVLIFPGAEDFDPSISRIQWLGERKKTMTLWTLRWRTFLGKSSETNSLIIVIDN
jgi:hypothetical protein